MLMREKKPLVRLRRRSRGRVSPDVVLMVEQTPNAPRICLILEAVAAGGTRGRKSGPALRLPAASYVFEGDQKVL